MYPHRCIDICMYVYMRMYVRPRRCAAGGALTKGETRGCPSSLLFILEVRISGEGDK